jgi:hypothetical protein
MHPVRQLLELSGILTVFFCGIVMSHYAWHNVTESSRITTKWAQESLFKHLLTIECHIWYLWIHFQKCLCCCEIILVSYGCDCRHIFATLSFIAETFIFLYVGMDALDIDKWKTSKERWAIEHKVSSLYLRLSQSTPSVPNYSSFYLF